MGYLTVQEVRKKLDGKGLLCDGSQLFNGVMKQRLNLKSEFSFGNIENYKLYREDAEKIYDYFTEIYYWVGKLDPKDIEECIYGSYSTFGSKFNCLTRDKEVMDYLERKYSLKNKFEDTKKTKTKKNKRFTKTKITLGLGLIGLGALIYKVK